MTPFYTDPLVTLLHGDCLEVMAALEADSVDAVVTDPPYGLEFMGKEWDAFKAKGRDSLRHVRKMDVAPESKKGNPWASERKSYGAVKKNPRCKRCSKLKFDHKPRKCQCESPDWDMRITESMWPFQAWCEQWGREALRVTKPGGYLLAFGGTRTHHRLVCALEDAGWIIRDELEHVYASGFPKSHNVSSNDRFCQCLPASEHQVRPVRDSDVSTAVAATDGIWPVLFEAVSESGLPATENGSVEVPLRGEEPGVEGWRDPQAGEGQLRRSPVRSGADVGAADGPEGRLHHGTPASHGRMDGSASGAVGSGEPSRPQPVEQRAVEPRAVAVERHAQGGGVWPLCDRCGKQMVPAGLGTALKPAHEPIILARKPLSGSVAENVARHGTGALNIDATRIGGRWPANLLLSDASLFDSPNAYVTGASADLEEPGYSRFFIIPKADRAERERGLVDRPKRQQAGDFPAMVCSECGSRFVLNGKTTCEHDADVREPGQPRANVHPTVKPIDLMRHLVRLVTPVDGVVLDPFLGSGTTCLAASEEGFRSIGIERELEYLEIAKGRLMTTPMGLGLDTPITGKKPPKTHPDLSKHQPKRRAAGENWSGRWAGTQEPTFESVFRDSMDPGAIEILEGLSDDEEPAA
jgi:DNA modification methylase